MKKISQMSLPELRTLALETDKLDVLWDIMTNCKDDPCTIQNIVSNPLTRFNAKLVRMAYDKGDTRVQITIARHTVDSSIIDDAACSDNRSVRANAALNPNINLPTLIRLSQDSWWGVRVNAFSKRKKKSDHGAFQLGQDPPHCTRKAKGGGKIHSVTLFFPQEPTVF